MRRLLALALTLALLDAFALAPPAVAGGEPLKVVLLSGAEEYETDRTLAAFRDHVVANYAARCTLLMARGVDDLPGLEALEDCDVALFFTRRLTLHGEQLDRVKSYARSGRPIVGVRTASHGFQNWLEFDRLVLGGNYQGHYRNDLPTQVSLAPGAAGHPVLAGIDGFKTSGSLYKTSPLADDATPLLVGTSPEGTEPVAWTRTFKGARVFYTSLGAQGDFDKPEFLRLLANALFWASEREPEPVRDDAP